MAEHMADYFELRDDADSMTTMSVPAHGVLGCLALHGPDRSPWILIYTLCSLATYILPFLIVTTILFRHDGDSNLPGWTPITLLLIALAMCNTTNGDSNMLTFCGLPLPQRWRLPRSDLNVVLRYCTECSYDLRAIGDAWGRGVRCPECGSSRPSVIKSAERMMPWSGSSPIGRRRPVLQLSIIAVGLAATLYLAGFTSLPPEEWGTSLSVILFAFAYPALFVLIQPEFVRRAVPPFRDSTLGPERMLLQRGICPACLGSLWHLSGDAESGLVECPTCAAKWKQLHEVIAPTEPAH